jgi:hypothetical protein
MKYKIEIGCSVFQYRSIEKAAQAFKCLAEAEDGCWYPGLDGKKEDVQMSLRPVFPAEPKADVIVTSGPIEGITEGIACP